MQAICSLTFNVNPPPREGSVKNLYDFLLQRNNWSVRRLNSARDSQKRYIARSKTAGYCQVELKKSCLSCPGKCWRNGCSIDHEAQVAGCEHSAKRTARKWCSSRK